MPPTDQPPSHPGAAGLHAVRARMNAAATACGRDPGAVTLVAVSKQQPWDQVAPVLAAGQRVYGENRVQEAQTRWTAVRKTTPGLELRLIGPLQTNKAEAAMVLFDVIETLDRERLARTLAQAAQAQGRCPRLYVQVNTGEEPQKAGVAPADADAFVAAARGDLRPDRGGVDVHPAGRRGGGAALRAAGQDRRPQRIGRAVDGHERGLRDRHPLRRYLGAGRLRGVRGSVEHDRQEWRPALAAILLFWFKSLGLG